MVANGMVVGMGVVLVALLAPSAQADIWCLRDAGRSTGGACVFPSDRECAMAARLNPSGGICERQPLSSREDADDKPTTDRRSPRRKGVDRW